MASPVANGAPCEANGSTSNSRSTTAAGHQQGKSSFAAKSADSNRKTEEDNSQRRSTQPKAWTSGVNPITQRSNTPSQMNGTGAKSANGADKPLERQVWTWYNAVGLQCTVTLKSGEKFIGIFSGAQKQGENHKYAFKMARDVTKEASNNEFCGAGPEHVVVFQSNHVEIFEIPEALPLTKSTANGAQGSFRTDTDISGNVAARERLLQRWEAPSAKGVDMSLESSSSGGWDQFAANAQLFGLKTDYDENFYTTSIDRSSAKYVNDSARAERIAAEIEGSAATNSHIREERGLDDSGDDEEEKYSGVRRDFQPLASNQPGRYIPPSKRTQDSPSAGTTPVSKPTAESVIDPAIISSQKARPEVSSEAYKAPPAAGATANLTINTGASSSKDSKAGKPPSKGVENDVLDHFRQFAANEKIKLQDQKRSRASQDKAVKLNDLMKFSQNFKLLTPVPKDLVPILAKDETKQKEIVQKAQQISQNSAKPSPTVADQKSNRPLAAARWENEMAAAVASTATKDGARPVPTSQAPMAKAGVPTTSPATPQPPQNSLSSRLTSNHQAHTARMGSGPVPNLPLQDNRNKGGRGNHPSLPSPQKSNVSRGPPSATSSSLKFNAKALEFNPTANAFKPGPLSGPTAASSPRSAVGTTGTISPTGPPPSLYRDRKNFTVAESTGPAKVVVETPADLDADGNGNAEAKAASKAQAANGGFPPPYRTAPTWHVDDPDSGPDQTMVYQARRPIRQTRSQSHASPGPSAMSYQLPHHMQGTPHVQQHHPVPHSQPSQSHHFAHGQHFEDNHMRPSQSQSSFAPSPRVGAQPMHYPSPMSQNANLAYQGGMNYPQAHPMGQRQFSNPPPQHMMPMQGTHLAAPMMVPGQPGMMPQQMAVPFNPQQMPVFATAQPMYGNPGQPHNGYPSPSRAPMMMHQGSQQGQQPMYMPQHSQPPHGQGQPVYAQYPPQQMPGMRGGYGSPQPPFAHANYPQHQQHHFSYQPHRTPSSGYVQPHQPQHQHHNTQAQHGQNLAAGSTESTEDAK